MKKTNIFIKSLLAVAFVAFVGCDDDTFQKANQDVEGLIGEDRKPNVTATLSDSNINEAGDPEVLITVNLDKAVDFPMPFTAVLAGGTADNNDFSANSVTIPAYSKQGVIKVTINDDIAPEETEVLELEVTPDGSPYIYEALGRPVVSLSIDNNATNDFTVQLDWDTLYDGVDGSSHHACDFDLDIEVYTSDFSSIVATSYSSCPEGITFAEGSLTDGDYWLVPSFWDSSTGVTPSTDFQIPAMLTVGKPGVWVETIDLTSQWDTATGGNAQGNPDAYLVKYYLTVSGNTYTVTDADSGSVIGTGRMSQSNLTAPVNFKGGRK